MPNYSSTDRSSDPEVLHEWEENTNRHGRFQIYRAALKLFSCDDEVFSVKKTNVISENVSKRLTG